MNNSDIITFAPAVNNQDNSTIMTFRFCSLIIFFIYTVTGTVRAQMPPVMQSGEILLEISKLNQLGTVMYLAAHPDDENTRLISYLANERKFRTVYLSLTRGSGGQNLIGNEQGAQLGMIRTQELLAARRNDGGEQTFSRCIDFGYSKNPEETFTKWNRDKALADVVWAIRKYRPDVIITRFPSTGEGGHGHHTASAILAEEAFTAAGDPSRFPEQLKYVSTWKPVRMFFNSFNFRFRPDQDFTGQIQIDVGGYNSLLGESYGEIASRATSNHKSQGFGVGARRGVQYEYLKRTLGDTSVAEFFQNIDTTWNRVNGSRGISDAISKVINSYKPLNPGESIPGLMKVRSLIAALPESEWKKVKLAAVDRIIAGCAGLWYEVNPESFYAVPGNNIKLDISAIARNYNNIKLTRLSIGSFDTIYNASLDKNVMFSQEKLYTVPEGTMYTNPYWLNSGSDGNMYAVNDQQMIGVPWNKPDPEAVFTFEIEGQQLSFHVPVSYKWTDPVKGQCYRPFEILPPVSVNVTEDVMTFTSPGKKELPVIIKSNIDNLKGNIRIEVPDGWKVNYPLNELSIPVKDGELQVTVEVIPPALSDISMGNTQNFLSVYFDLNGKSYGDAVTCIEHEHLPAMVNLNPCKVKLVAFSIQSAITRIGYINGAGDKVAEYLRLAGFTVDVLDAETIKTGDLSVYGAILTGIRAYNTIEDITNYYQPLMNYISGGGNLVVQYNTNNFVSSLDTKIGPYEFKISRKRVTDENAEARFLDKNSPLINSPNLITQSDFSGWVQERGLYFADECAPEYKKVIAWNDKGEDPLDGGLIYTQYGKGYFIYTGISFFRQLPAGVPGAYRLLVNLINAGK